MTDAPRWQRLCQLAESEIERTLAALPLELQTRARQLPVTIEAVPNDGLVEDGIDPETLGLFVGPEHADAGFDPIPSQIILFLENIWDLAAGDEEIFCEEVHITLLHELGHYLGLDEDDLFDRGLD